MERLLERQTLIIDSLKQQFQGRTNHGQGAWTDIRNAIAIFYESCQSVIERLKRRKKIQDENVDLSSMMLGLFEKLMEIVDRAEGFPVSSLYQSETSQWLVNQFRNICTELEFNSKDFNDAEEPHKYEFKTYQLATDVCVTCLEEFKKMGNKDGTTGLITWQGSLALFNFANTCGMPLANAKILELGSGAGLFGMGVLKSFPNQVTQYTFSDVHADVLNAIAINCHLNFTSCYGYQELKTWLRNGPPIQKETHLKTASEQGIQIQHLDWLDCSDELIESLDYDIIFGADLTYTLCLLQPLANLIKRLLKAKSECNSAFIACTHRKVGSIETFLQHVQDEGMDYSVAWRTTFGPQDACVVSHEPLHTVTIFKIRLTKNQL